MMKMKHLFRLLLTLSLLGSALLVPAQATQAATTYPVIVLDKATSGFDDVAFDPTTCTLRQAIIAINRHNNYAACKADSTTTTIMLPQTDESDPYRIVNLSIQNKTTPDEFTGDLNITTNMNIIGHGETSIVGWGGTSWDRVFHISGGAKVTMSGFTIKNGTARSTSLQGTDGGGIYSINSSLTLQNMTLENNFAYGGGGAIASFGSGSSLNLNVVNIISNTGDLGSGGIYSQGNLRVENSYFEKNISRNILPAKSATLNYANPTKTVAAVINNTTFSENEGYGISNSSFGNLILSYLTMVGGTDSALYLNVGTWTYLRDSILSNNYRDCFNNGGSFADGGYNIINTPVLDDNACAYNNGDANDSRYHTIFTDPVLDASASIVGSHYTKVYPFTMMLTNVDFNPVYNHHPVDAASGICVSPALPSGVTPPSGVVIPAMPGYDQYLGPRPIGDENNNGCDTGAYELGAYDAIKKIYMPSLRRFN